MVATKKHLFDQTAADLMTGVVLSLAETTPLREAAKELARAKIHGAPVVDAAGRCVGTFSVSDVARWAVNRSGPVFGHARTCPYQEPHRGVHGEETILCRLPTGRCPYQFEKTLPDGQVVQACHGTDSFCLDWQMVDVEELPAEDVKHYMTAEPVTSRTTTPIAELARQMVNATIQRVIVVDADSHPVGVVAASDLVAALAGTADRDS